MIERTVIAILGMLEVIIWMWGICQLEFKKKRIVFLCGVLITLFVIGIAMLEFWFGKNIYIDIVFVLFPLISCCLIFQGKVIHNFIKYWFSMFYVDMVYHPLKIIYSIFNLDKIYFLNRYKDEIFSIITILILLLFSFQIKKRKAWVRWIQNIPIGYYSIGFLFAFAAGGISYFIEIYRIVWNESLQKFVQILQIIVLFFLYASGIGIAFLNLWKENYRKESVLKDKYLNILREHYQGMKNHIDEVQSLRHDMKNHMYILEKYIESGNLEQALDYIKQIEEHQQWKSKPLISVGNELVDAVLSSEIRKIDSDIIFEYEGGIPQELKIQEFDLCTLFSNLLSNSIDACKNLKYKQKIIQLSIRHFQNKVLISVKNPIEKEIEIEKLGKFTTKKDNIHHGYGIRNIKNMVDKYNGTVKFIVVDGWFEVKIWIDI